jgi:hypothetical protein
MPKRHQLQKLGVNKNRQLINEAHKRNWSEFTRIVSISELCRPNPFQQFQKGF